MQNKGCLCAFEEISRRCTAFIFLQCFKLARTHIQESFLHNEGNEGIDHQILIGNRFHVKLRSFAAPCDCVISVSQLVKIFCFLSLCYDLLI